jgi:hypothetical protein
MTGNTLILSFTITVWSWLVNFMSNTNQTKSLKFSLIFMLQIAFDDTNLGAVRKRRLRFRVRDFKRPLNFMPDKTIFSKTENFKFLTIFLFKYL